MSIGNHLETFYGLPVAEVSEGDLPEDLSNYAPALRVEYDSNSDAFQSQLDQVMAHPEAAQLKALIIGTWDGEQFDAGNEQVVELLVGLRERLPALRAIFLGDIVGEECEISWINQGDVSPLLHAYPALEVFGVRGGVALTFGELRHPNLRELVVETGGLSGEAVRQLGAAYLPSLERLDLWLGTPDYGGDATVEDLAPILSGKAFPKLRALGLKNSQIQGEVLTALLGSPVLDQVEELDISMGTLIDEQVVALQTASASKLKALNVSDNYLTEAGVASLRGRHFEVISHSQRQEHANYPGSRYCAVTE